MYRLRGHAHSGGTAQFILNVYANSVVSWVDSKSLNVYTILLPEIQGLYYSNNTPQKFVIRSVASSNNMKTL